MKERTEKVKGTDVHIDSWTDDDVYDRMDEMKDEERQCQAYTDGLTDGRKKTIENLIRIIIIKMDWFMDSGF